MCDWTTALPSLWFTSHCPHLIFPSYVSKDALGTFLVAVPSTRVRKNTGSGWFSGGVLSPWVRTRTPIFLSLYVALCWSWISSSEMPPGIPFQLHSYRVNSTAAPGTDYFPLSSSHSFCLEIHCLRETTRLGIWLSKVLALQVQGPELGSPEPMCKAGCKVAHTFNQRQRRAVNWVQSQPGLHGKLHAS